MEPRDGDFDLSMLFSAVRKSAISLRVEARASASGIRERVGAWVRGMISMCAGKSSSGYVVSVVSGPLAVVT